MRRSVVAALASSSAEGVFTVLCVSVLVLLSLLRSSTAMKDVNLVTSEYLDSRGHGGGIVSVFVGAWFATCVKLLTKKALRHAGARAAETGRAPEGPRATARRAGLASLAHGNYYLMLRSTMVAFIASFIAKSSAPDAQ